MTNVLSFEMEKTKEWRQRKAERHREDVRNQEAGSILDTLSGQTADVELTTAYEALADELSFDDMGEANSAVLKEIGFHFNPKHVDEVLARIIGLVKDRDA